MRHSTLLAIIACLFGCGDGNSFQPVPVPINSFSGLSEYTQNNFDLGETSEYWEVRRGDDGGSGDLSAVLYQSDTDAYELLSAQDLALLEAQSSISGFTYTCLPGSCPIYAVTLDGGSARTISSDAELKLFFADINTEAELYIWLWANNYSAKLFDQLDDGYRVLVEWDDYCGKRGERIVHVGFDGEIIELIDVLTESYDGCA